MPTTTDHPAPAVDVPGRRGRLSSRASALSVVVASIATFGVLYLVLSSQDPVQRVQSIPAQPNTVSQQVAEPLPPAPLPPAQSTAPPQPQQPRPQPQQLQPQTPAFAIDSLGYVDSARCDPRQRAVAIARTERATMVICESSDGTYQYQGIRLRDGASLELDDVRPMAAGFEARNDETTYRLSPTELVVLSGEELQSRDAVLDYRVGGA